MRPTAASLHAYSRRRKQRTGGPETGLALGEPKGNQNYFLAELAANIKNNIKPKTTKNAFFFHISHFQISYLHTRSRKHDGNVFEGYIYIKFSGK